MNLHQQLASVLPKGLDFKTLYVQSEPKECTNLIKFHKNHSNTEEPQLTVKIKHFLLVIHDDLILFGIEVYNYFTVADINTQYLFVSKVDTSGLLNIKINTNKIINKFLQYLVSVRYTTLTYRLKNSHLSTIKQINKLLNPQGVRYKTVDLSPKCRIKLSLFTKSSNQYFFPESSKNPHKHLIDGDKLLRWWMKLVGETLDAKFTKKLLIPGALSPRQYLLEGWEVGSVFGNDELAVYNVPNFPDDPKTRFLEFLVIENRIKVNLQAFYEELGFRQEFRLGNVVGIIGCESMVFTQTPQNTMETNPVVLPNKQYKRLIKVIKSEDFTIADDIRLLVTLKLPFFLKLNNKEFDYTTVTGTYEHQATTKSGGPVQVNNLTLFVRRKK